MDLVEIIITQAGGTRTIIVKRGDNLLDALRANGIHINAACGGRGVCDKCKVKVAFSGATEYVKSCGYEIKGDIAVQVEDYKGRGLYELNSIDYEVIKAEGYGIAADIGTTTVITYLVRLSDGKVIDVADGLNAQLSYGADVLSRIFAAKSSLKDLSRLIREQINGHIEYFEDKHRVKVIKAVISGNTTMLYLLKGIDPAGLGVYPFGAEEPLSQSYGDIINCGDTRFLPWASAYIGGDIVSGVLSSGMMKDGISILVDIGTNGEIVLNRRGELYGASAAAGPAFEGAVIACGMGGVPGAIDHVYYDEKLSYSVIDGEAKGICGSGLVDAVAVMLKTGILDKSGAVAAQDKLTDNKFYLTDKVYISDRDVRQYQLAKSAIRAGIEALTEYARVNLADIDKIYLAGGFGNYLDIDNAVYTGLLPVEFKDSYINTGNSSGQGAIMCLLNPGLINKAYEIAKAIRVIELSGNQSFIEKYINYMSF
ncbi:MAG: ASKHA domain-containing protein [Christensenellales bacterium]|jgi:uncharacterized 2Fe-2S/4Fe-4S cluster protein (DUF4445 family)